MTSQNSRAKSESITSFRNWIIHAQYEADTDPYHGIFDTNHDHAFMKCSKTLSLLQEKNHHDQVTFLQMFNINMALPALLCNKG